MKTQTLLSMTLLIGLLGGTAGNAAEPASICKKLHVENPSLYFVDVTYKKCPGGELTKERVSSLTGNQIFSIDPSIKSTDELKIKGVGLIQGDLWHSASAERGWKVTCYGSIVEPICTGTPLDKSECKALIVKNEDMPTIQIEYSECKTKVIQKPTLDKSESDTYYVEPGTNLQINLVGGEVGGIIWPAPPSKAGIGSGKKITCHKGSMSCDAKPLVK